MSSQIDQKTFDTFFRTYKKIALVQIRASKSKSSNYDPFRNTGYDINSQNPFPVKVLTKAISASGLRYTEIGLRETGAIQIIVHNRDVVLIKHAEKITLNGDEYTAYSDAVGNRFLIFPTQFAKYSRIILFRKKV